MVGFYPIYQAKQEGIQKEIKRKIREGLPEDQLHKIYFAKDETPHWVKPGKEFILKDKMYDVARKLEKQDGIVYLCLDDTEEKKLLSDISVSMDKKNEKKPTPQRIALELFKRINFNEVLIQPILTHTFEGQRKGIYHSHFLIQNGFLSTSTPPPDFLSLAV